MSQSSGRDTWERFSTLSLDSGASDRKILVAVDFVSCPAAFSYSKAGLTATIGNNIFWISMGADASSRILSVDNLQNTDKASAGRSKRNYAMA